MAVDFATFSQIVNHVTAVRKPVLLRGRHGIGKSTVVYQFADKNNLEVVERRASQMTEGDLVGLPTIEDKSTTFNPPDWFKAACDRPVVLFLDEVDRATLEVRQGIFELTDSRKLNGHNLHPDTLVFAAVNGGEHGSQYQVGEMDPAELDRWTVFDIDPTVEDWLSWASDAGISPEIWNFINQNRTHLEHTDDYEPNKVYPSRRSWERLDQCLTQAGLLEEASPALYTLTSAFVGFEAAVAFNDYVQNYDRQVTTEDILVKGDFSKVADFGINDHTAIIDKFEAEGTFKDELDQELIDNLARYFVMLPSEVAMKLWTVMGKGEVNNTVKLHKTDIDGESVSKHFVRIINGTGE
ncbi:MAG: AAA domain-containing protein [Candidatus Peribacter sp.]|jgi:MoxR-like ATPase|nr:AAA domain-containing protein [Candidatus Peribacter sp.]